MRSETARNAQTLNKSIAHIYQTATEICNDFPSACGESSREKVLGGMRKVKETRQKFLFGANIIVNLCVYMLVSLFRERSELSFQLQKTKVSRLRCTKHNKRFVREKSERERELERMRTFPLTTGT